MSIFLTKYVRNASNQPLEVSALKDLFQSLEDIYESVEHRIFINVPKNGLDILVGLITEEIGDERQVLRDICIYRDSSKYYPNTWIILELIPQDEEIVKLLTTKPYHYVRIKSKRKGAGEIIDFKEGKAERAVWCGKTYNF